MNYIKHAKQNCCNYQQTVIHNKDCVRTNYCWRDSAQCNLHPDKDLGCFWYVNAVLPLDKKLQAQWRSENPIMGQFIPVNDAEQIIESKSNTPKKTCGCGKKFTPTNNRQKTCKVCSTPKLKMRRLRAKTKDGV